jgi:2-polyprenyl-6-methoxyphenol hydroxylase-like FAD-dependent oxidoreductase
VEYDVAICGGGPVGLTLACELRLAGARVLVLEQLTEIDHTFKANSINLTTAEALYRRGLLEQVGEQRQLALAKMKKFLPKSAPPAGPAGQPAPSSPPAQPGQGGPGVRTAMPGVAGHFAGIPISSGNVDFTDPEFRDAGPAAGLTGVGVSQQAVELILGRRAAELGADVRRGTALTDFTVADDGVTLRFGGEQAQASWLVACDGGHSMVRKQAGFDFPGTGPSITGRQALVEMTDADQLPGGWTRTETGICLHGPVPGRIATIEFDGPPADRSAPVTPDELTASVRRVTGVPVTVTAVRTATRFSDNARQVPGYRRGRVLVAGDAAHVHSPFGGQGLNLGIGDAMNLGWKLGAVVAGWAPDGLLDSYSAERVPIGARVLEWSRAQVALMRTDPRTQSLRVLVTELLATADGATYLVKQLSGVLHHYDLGQDHPLAGHSAPDLALDDGTRLARHCAAGRGVLLDLAGPAGLRAAAAGWADRVDVVTAGLDPASQERSGPLTGVLVRPDGFVAWAASDGGQTGLAEALGTWFGRPAPAPGRVPVLADQAGVA